jgi:effector-binding domain-containing protein
MMGAMEYDVTLEDREEQPTAVVRGHVTHNGVGHFIRDAFGELFGALNAAGVSPAGPPFARYRIVGDGFDVEAGLPVAEAVDLPGAVVSSTLPGGSVAATIHVGSYAGIAAAFRAVEAWLETSGYVIDGDPWETYLDAPGVPEPRTQVCFPCHAG